MPITGQSAPSRGFYTIVLLALVLLAISIPATALRVEGMKIQLDVEAGKTYTYPMAVSSNADEPAMDVAIDVMGIGNYPAGSYKALSPAEDTGLYSARSFVTAETTRVHLNPGDRHPFNLTIRVPPDVGNGGRYAMILIHPVSAQGTAQGAGVSTALIASVLLTVQGSNLIRTGSITNLQVDEAPGGRSLEAQTTIRNTGNYHYYGTLVNITITDTSGRVVATGSTPPSFFSLFPGNEITLAAPISSALAPGSYTLKSEARIADGLMFLDSRTVPVTIASGYTPPFKESSIDLAPDRAGTLATQGGEVTILFPQGSVISPVHVTVEPVTGDLAPAPPLATAGSTSFVVGGVTGLLSKDATVKVKYTADDLKATRGDPSHLVIARWDADKSQWTLLPTASDASAKTLTITTNRLGTMAVMGSEQSPAATQTIPAGTSSQGTPWPDAPVTGVAISAALILWLAGKK